MTIDATYLIKELEKMGIRINSNVEPPILLAAGNNQLRPITKKTGTNHQVFLSVYEIERSEVINTVERIERRLLQELPNSKVLPFPIEGIDNVKSTIDTLSAHYGVPLTKDDIISKMDRGGTDYFYLFLVIIESAYYY